MSQGVLRLCTIGGEHLFRIPTPMLRNPARVFSRSVRLLNQDGKPVEVIRGVPYKNLTIGVPKERWINEKRYNKLGTILKGILI